MVPKLEKGTMTHETKPRPPVYAVPKLGDDAEYAHEVAKLDGLRDDWQKKQDRIEVLRHAERKTMVDRGENLLRTGAFDKPEPLFGSEEISRLADEARVLESAIRLQERRLTELAGRVAGRVRAKLGDVRLALAQDVRRKLLELGAACDSERDFFDALRDNLAAGDTQSGSGTWAPCQITRRLDRTSDPYSLYNVLLQDADGELAKVASGADLDAGGSKGEALKPPAGKL